MDAEADTTTAAAAATESFIHTNHPARLMLLSCGGGDMLTPETVCVLAVVEWRRRCYPLAELCLEGGGRRGCSAAHHEGGPTPLFTSDAPL